MTGCSRSHLRLGCSERPSYGISSTLPVVCRPASAMCAWAACASGYAAPMRTCKLTRCHHAEHGVGVSQVVGARLDVGEQRRPGNEQRAQPAEPLDVKRSREAARLPVGHHVPQRRQAVQALVEGVLAHRIVGHLHTRPTGDALDLGQEILLGVNDNLIGAGPRASFAFSSVDTVPITRAPCILAICVSSRPTPPAAACTSAQSPRLSG